MAETLGQNAPTINQQTRGWVGALISQRAGLRIYQWLWIVLCTIGALAAAAPRILSQPVIYMSSAAVQIDIGGRYHELYTDGKPDADFIAVQHITFELLRVQYPELGSPTLHVRFEPHSNGSIDVIAVGSSAIEAQMLADSAAEELARSVRAAGGREILRNLLGWELAAALRGDAPETPFQSFLREIIRTGVFSLNRPIEPVSQHITADELAAPELSDLTRALEVGEVQTRIYTLPALGLQLATAEGAVAEQITRDQQRLTDGLQAIRDALNYLYVNHDARFDPTVPSDAFRSAPAFLPAAPENRMIPWLLGLTVLFGLLFGLLGVIVDRSAGVMSKARELWFYRELIRNLVLRDLRVRYKGSALGYLWTQLAPLLLMLVFWFVFSVFFQSGIAMFAVFLIVGLLVWNYCAESVSGGTRSIIDNSNLIKKVFFPREVLPLVNVFSGLLNYILSLPTMLLVMAVVQLLYSPLQGSLNFSWTMAYLPILLIIQTIFLAGVTLFTSSLAVFFRDAVHLIGIIIQFWFFLTPVLYSLDAIDATIARIIRWVNPMASLVDFYREILYGNTVADGLIPTPGLPALTSVLRVLITSIIVLALGYWFFQRNSGRFGEEI